MFLEQLVARCNFLIEALRAAHLARQQGDPASGEAILWVMAELVDAADQLASTMAADGIDPEPALWFKASIRPELQPTQDAWRRCSVKIEAIMLQESASPFSKYIPHREAIAMLPVTSGLTAKEQSKFMEQFRKSVGRRVRTKKPGKIWLYHRDDLANVAKGYRRNGRPEKDNVEEIEKRKAEVTRRRTSH